MNTLKSQEASQGDKTTFKREEKIDVGVYDAFNKPVYTNDFLMCCYLNIGFEPRVGALVERNRVKSRCLQKLNYAFLTFIEGCFCRRRNSMKSKVKRIVSRQNSDSEAIRADLSVVPTNPYNMVCQNISSMYGGRVTKENW